MIEFYKYHGCGNDFILIDNRDGSFKLNKIRFSRKWCERRFGIGSDGIIFLEEHPELDFKMDFYNPDGSQSFCGNGSRCVMAFAKRVEMIIDEASFEAIDGQHKAKFTAHGVCVKMSDVNGIEKIDRDHFIYTGSPHYISYEGETKRDIVSYGKSVRYSERFKDEGTNVNLINETGTDSISVLTYERGVENETYACGTGATACALSFGFKHQLKEGPIKVKVKGGNLIIHFTRSGENFEDVWLEGPADFVYKGEIDE